MKKHRIFKSLLVGVASLALIVPLVGNTGTSAHAAHHSRYYYENLIYDPGSDMLSDEDEMQLIIQHPFLKHIHIVKAFMSCYPYWGDSDAYDYYAHHFKQLYSPYLYPSMAKRITPHDSTHYKRDEYLLHKAQVQMGLLGHHRKRNVRHHARRQSHKRTRRINRHHQRNRRRNRRSHRSHRR